MRVDFDSAWSDVEVSVLVTSCAPVTIILPSLSNARLIDDFQDDLDSIQQCRLQFVLELFDVRTSAHCRIIT